MVMGLGRKKANKKEPAKKKAADNKSKTADNTEEEGVIGEPSIESAPAQAAPDTAPPSAEQQATPPLTAKTVPGPPAEEIYADGISSLSFRANVVKLDCYRVVGQDPQENTESRMISHRLVMPALAIQELIQLLQNASERQRERAARTEDAD